MIESDRLQPVDANVYLVRVVATGNLEILAASARRCRRRRHRNPAQQLLHALDAVIQLQIDTHVEDVADLLVEHIRGQPKLRDIGAHQAARRIERLENRHFVAQRAKVVGYGQRSAARADQCDFLAVTLAAPCGSRALMSSR